MPPGVTTSSPARSPTQTPPPPWCPAYPSPSRRTTPGHTSHVVTSLRSPSLKLTVSSPPEPRRKRAGRVFRSPVSLLGIGAAVTRPSMTDLRFGDVHFLTLAQLGERYRRYRLPDPDAEAAM